MKRKHMESYVSCSSTCGDFGVTFGSSASGSYRREGFSGAYREMCSRPSRRRVRNTSYSEQAGTCGNAIVTRRFDNSRLTCVCRAKVY